MRWLWEYTIIADGHNVSFCWLLDRSVAGLEQEIESGSYEDKLSFQIE
jgi:hypothetical protein